MNANLIGVHLNEVIDGFYLLSTFLLRFFVVNKGY